MSESQPRPPRPPKRRYTPRPRRSDLCGSHRVHHDLPGRWRLGWGELADERLRRDMARFWFFVAVDHAAPEVYRALAERVFPAYQAFFLSATGGETPAGPGDEEFLLAALSRFVASCRLLPGPPALGSILGVERLRTSAKLSPLAAALGAALDGWGGDYYLLDAWCLDTALHTLLQLQTNEFFGLPEPSRPTGFKYPTIGLPPDPARQAASATPPLPGLSVVEQALDDPYDPHRETRVEAKLRLGISRGAGLEAYLDAVEASYPDADRVELHAAKHFLWLARHQCLGDSYINIAREEAVHVPTVSRQAGRLALLLGLTPRRLAGGHPRSKRDTHSRWRRG